jgi:hypothetical protein
MLDHYNILTLFYMLEGFFCSLTKVFFKLISSSKSFIKDFIMAIGMGSCSYLFCNLLECVIFSVIFFLKF